MNRGVGREGEMALGKGAENALLNSYNCPICWSVEERRRRGERLSVSFTLSFSSHWERM